MQYLKMNIYKLSFKINVSLMLLNLVKDEDRKLNKEDESILLLE